jgi:Phosphotransferase enzyme family
MSDLPLWCDEWCRVFLDVEPVEVLFAVSHLSEVVGVRLADGRDVVVKRRSDEVRRTRHCVYAQRLLAGQGFPCPMPVTEVVFSGPFAVHAERFVGGGEVECDDGPAVAEKSAVLLADLVGHLALLDLAPPLPNPEWVAWDSLPERHGTADAPAWIEDTSSRVRGKLAGCRLPPVLGHADWEAQNMRWLRGEPLAVLDWDSLAWLPEAALAGTAAGVFASHDKPTLAPIESSGAFLDAYDRARNKRFSSYEREIAWAASLWVALHNARDELIFNRPRLSYERLKEQHRERLIRACAT